MSVSTASMGHVTQVYIPRRSILQLSCKTLPVELRLTIRSFLVLPDSNARTVLPYVALIALNHHHVNV